ncbi:MAG: type IX secretion system sortase PorU [Chitinophagaceae bacterium]
MRNVCFLIVSLLLITCTSRAQRSYANSSVLASGNWYKLGVKDAGVYKIDIPLLNKLGINTSSVPSAAIRVFGNGGAMLPEAGNGFKYDDLAENAIEVVDGGDGLLNGNDYILFYATGTSIWMKDSANQSFRHQQSLYGKTAYYFVSIGGAGKRIQTQNTNLVPNTVVNSFSERWFHELDAVNLLNSGKDWYGEELSALPGKSHSFTLPLSNIVTTQPANLVAVCAARSVTGSSRFSFSANGQAVLQQDIAAVGNTNLDLFAKSTQSTASFTPGSTIALSCGFTPGGASAQGWIDWLEVFCRRSLVLTGSEQLLFRDWNSVAPNAIAAFNIKNAASSWVWDITNSISPVIMKSAVNGNELSFINNAASLHEYIAFSSSFLLPEALGKIANQDLHNVQLADLIIVTYPSFLPAAQQIALLHQQKDNLKTVLVTTEQVFNEFSSGQADPTAIRDFVKMYYDRAAGDAAKRPKYLLLLGDASFDYKDRVKNNTNYVPAYESNVSLDPLATYTSDDFFGFLDDNEDIGAGQLTNLLDIGIGRIPAQTPAQAKAYADKLVDYTDPKSLGPWRNEQTFVADDQDQNLHLNDAEIITAAAASINPLFIQHKIYLDAYVQDRTPFGSRYPEVNAAINNQVQQGTLIWNYNGHGSYDRLAEETVLEKPMADAWNNAYRLPLFITATCDFAPYDNPAIPSLGENILLRGKTGAIALMTTTRLVFAFSNRIMNRNYLQAALQARPDGSYASLGEAVKQAKNNTYQTQFDHANNRKFTLLGDPALTLAYPMHRVQTTTVNGRAITVLPDTLKALQQYNIGGNITDAKGSAITDFNGTLYATVFDKTQTLSTRVNDADSYQQNFRVLRAQLFKGRVKVVNGKFNFSFIVPKDINLQPGNATISYYADNGQLDANGSFSGLLTGGPQGASSDNTGPAVNAYLNDTAFVNGGAVPATPLLLLKLADSSGINIVGTGHDITVIIDGDATQIFVLNEFFESELDSYQKGTVQYQLPALAEGAHTMVIKAWDVANNSTEVSIPFRVLKSDGLSIYSIINYPNPFTAATSFRFEHNRPNQDLRVRVRIFTVLGKLVKTVETTINTPGSRSSDIGWNGLDDHGGKQVPGIYIYQLQLTLAADGETALKSGKLVLY